MAEDKTKTVPTALSVNPEPEAWGEIHTMPSLQPNAQVTTKGPVAAKPQPAGKRKWWLWAVVGLLVVAGGVGTYLTYFAPAPATQTNQEVATPTPTPTPTPAPTPQPPSETAADRDAKRLSDISSLQTGLAQYASEHSGKYPVALLPLVLGSETTRVLSASGFSAQASDTVYLATVPQNPPTGGADYLYDSPDGTTYTITFRLEVGSGAYSTGDHQASPAGIDAGAAPAAAPSGPRTVTPPLTTQDSDHDGLTDAEEPLFGADPARADTDGDGYPDGQEVQSGYDPAVGGGAKLSDSKYFATYENQKFGYTIKYPKVWLAKATDKNAQDEIIFNDTNDPSEFVEVLVTDNTDHETAAAWYAKNAPETGLTDTQVPTLAVGNLTWALSLNGLNAYLATDKYLFTVSYNIGTHTEASYLEVFQTMVKLFQLTSAGGTPLQLNTNTNTPVQSPSNNGL